MSLEATIWAWKQQGLRPAEKLVLLSFAERAGEDHTAFPSARRMKLDTGLDRKTILAAVNKLVELGLLADTGERKGKTQGVRVFRLPQVVGRDEISDPENGTTTTTSGPKNGTPSSPKNGTTKRSQKRDTEPVSNNQSLEARGARFDVEEKIYSLIGECDRKELDLFFETRQIRGKPNWVVKLRPLIDQLARCQTSAERTKALQNANSDNATEIYDRHLPDNIRFAKPSKTAVDQLAESGMKVVS